MLQMLCAGMNVARLNFSHGDLNGHRTAIGNLPNAARTAGKRVTIMADLPGPKMRIGQLAEEPIELNRALPIRRNSDSSASERKIDGRARRDRKRCRGKGLG